MLKPKRPKALLKHTHSLAFKITLALLIKAIMLFILWKYFFSAPPTHHMQLPIQQVESHLVSRMENSLPFPKRMYNAPATTHALTRDDSYDANSR